MESPSVPPPGSLLADKYRVQRILGQGGMGVVLEATHELLATPVAVKVMSATALEQENAIPRFLREARAAAALKSEYVARVTDFGTLPDGRPFMVMELLAGEDLSAIHKGAGMSRQEWIDALLQACAGLAEAHVAGILHRDLKLANFFRTTRPDGSPCTKILDFGISKLAKPDGLTDTTTKSTNLLGTPYYMSPEHVRSSRDVDARSDIWQMGVALYQVMTGHLPFEGDNVGMLFARILELEPRPPTDLVPDLPAPIAQVILACLEKIPALRPATVAQLAAWLEPFAGPEGRLAAQRARSMQASQLSGEVSFSSAPVPAAYPIEAVPDRSAPAASVSSAAASPGVAPRSEWTEAPVSTSVVKPAAPLSMIAAAVVLVLGAAVAIAFYVARGPTTGGVGLQVESAAPAVTGPPVVPAQSEASTTGEPAASSAPATASAPVAAPTSSADAAKVQPVAPSRPAPGRPPSPRPTPAKPAPPERPTLH